MSKSTTKSTMNPIADGCRWEPYPVKCLDSPMVRVIIGPDEEVVQIHRGILIHYSGYFRGALLGNFAEAEQQVCTLEDVNPTLFAILRDWLYTGSLDPESPRLKWGDDYNSPYHFPLLWVLADRLLIPMLKNCAMNDLVGYVNLHMPLKFKPNLVWSLTSPNSILRKFVVASYGRLLVRSPRDFIAQDIADEMLEAVYEHIKVIGVHESKWPDLTCHEFHGHLEATGVTGSEKSSCGKSPWSLFPESHWDGWKEKKFNLKDEMIINMELSRLDNLKISMSRNLLEGRKNGYKTATLKVSRP